MSIKEVFISYSSKDYSEADSIRVAFEKNGITCWIAPDDIPYGSNYAREIPAAIKGCKAFVLVLSNRAQDSVWVARELDIAVNERKLILPIIIEECTLTDEFNFYLIGAQWYEAYRHREKGINDVIDLLLKVTGKEKAVLDVEPEKRKSAAFSNQKDDKSESITPIEKQGRKESSFSGAKAIPTTSQKSIANKTATQNEGSAKSVSVFPEPEDIRNYIRFKRYSQHSVFMVSSMDAIRKNLGIPRNSEIFLAHDDSGDRSCKYGFAICSDGIYLRRLFYTNVAFTSWETFLVSRGVVLLNDGYLGIYDRQNRPICIGSVSDLYEKQVARKVLNEIYVNFAVKGKDAELYSRSQNSGRKTLIPISSGVKDFIVEGNYRRRVMFQVSSIKAVRANFFLPTNCDLYIAYDDTAVKDCKSGFAICNNGVYYRKTFSGKTAFISWSRFFSARAVVDLGVGSIGIVDKQGATIEIARVSATSDRTYIKNLFYGLHQKFSGQSCYDFTK